MATTVNPIDAILQIIGDKESGGDYNKQNASGSGAYGKYQIMPSSWAEWAPQAGLPANAPQTPENQELVARYKIGEYYKMYGGDVRKVAIAWYDGPGANDWSDEEKNKVRFVGGDRQPTTNEYANDFEEKYRALVAGKTVTAPTSPTTPTAPASTPLQTASKEPSGIVDFAAFIENLAFFKRMQDAWDQQPEQSLHAFIADFIRKFYHNLIYIPTLPNNKVIVIKPETMFANPPHCNIIYPKMRTSSQLNRNIKAEPTRIMLISNPVNLLFGGSREQLTNIITLAHMEYVDGKEDVVKFKRVAKGKTELPMRVLSEYEKKNGVRILKTEAGADLYLFIKSRSTGDKTAISKDMSVDYKDRKTYSIKLGDQTPAEAKAEIGEVLFNLARYMLLRTRYTQRGGSYGTLFNPYAIPGFPFANIEDVADSSLIMHGYVTQISISLNPQSTGTTISYTASHIAKEAKPNAFPIVEAEYVNNIEATYKKMLDVDASSVSDIQAERKWYAENGNSISQLYERIWRPLTSMETYLKEMADGAALKVHDDGYMYFEGSFFDSKTQDVIKKYTESLIAGRAMATSDVY